MPNPSASYSKALISRMSGWSCTNASLEFQKCPSARDDLAKQRCTNFLSQCNLWSFQHYLSSILILLFLQFSSVSLESRPEDLSDPEVGFNLTFLLSFHLKGNRPESATTPLIHRLKLYTNPPNLSRKFDKCWVSIEETAKCS